MSITHTLSVPAHPETEQEPVCAVCPHPLSGHDPIGLRFCAATIDGAHDRGCACRS